ncbi:hypothetical protein ACFW9X_22685, partial [Streptomyces sp. NPDC059466]
EYRRQRTMCIRDRSETDKPSDSSPKTLTGRVVKTSSAAPGTGVVVVDVATSAADGPTAAAWLSAGTLRLVLAAPDGR